jgi:Putative auto-transporter adhesin, head GIN domain
MIPRGIRPWLVAAAVPLLLVLAAGCTAVPGTGGDVTGSGTPTTKTYDYSGFTGLRVDNAFAATVTYGGAFGVTVTVDDNLVKYLRVELDGDTLHIGLDPNMSYQNATLKAEVTMPSLRALEVSGGATADVTGFASEDDLELRLSGGGKVSLAGFRAGDVGIDVSGAARLSGDLEAQELSGEASGAGQVALAGSASKAQLEASGAGKLDLKDLTLKDADLQLSGGASGTVRVTGTLTVEASGGARLDYYGSPTQVQTNVSGGAQVNRAGG